MASPPDFSRSAAVAPGLGRNPRLRLLTLPVVVGLFAAPLVAALAGLDDNEGVLWTLHLLALVLLASRWGTRGVLASAVANVAMYSAAVLLLPAIAAGNRQPAIGSILLVALTNLVVAGLAAWVVERVRRAQHARQGAEADLRAARQLAAELADAEERYRALVERVPTVSYTAALDEHSTTLYVSPQIEALLGYAPERITGDAGFWLANIHPDDRAAARGALKHAGASGDAAQLEYRARSADGRYVWLRDEVRIVRDVDGRPRFMQGVLSDISARRGAEEALRLRDRAVAAASNGIVITDPTRPDNPIVYVNPAFERITGYAAAEALGRNCRFLQGPATAPEAVADVRSGLAQAREFTVTLLNYRKDGAPFWNELRLAPVFDTAGALVNFIGVLADVSERKRATEQLRLAEERYRAIIEQMPAVTGVSLNDAPGSNVFVSPQIEAMLGYSVEEWLDDPDIWLRSVHSDDRERVNAEHLCANATGEPFIAEYRMRARDGHVVWVRDYAVLVPAEPGNDARWQWLKFDITAQKRAEEAARAGELARLEAQARYRMLVENVPAVTYIQASDAAATTLFVSPQIMGLVGYSPDEWLADADLWLTLIHPDDRDGVQAEHLRTNASRDPFRMEYRFIARDGRVVWVRDEGVLVTDADGAPRFWQGVFLDITERKRAEESAREAEAKHRTLIEQMPAVIYTAALDATGSTLFISPRVEDMLGYSPDEVLANPNFWMGHMHPDDRSAAREVTEAFGNIGQGMTREYRMLGRDGRVVWVRDQWETISDEDGRPRHVQGVWTDITAEKLAEERRRVAEQRYQSLIEQMPVVVYMDRVDEHSSTLYVSPRVAEMTGYPPETWTSTPNHWRRVLHPDDAERVLALHAASIASGEPFRAEYRIRAADGRVVWVRDEALILRDATGRPTRIQGIWSDITAQREAQERLRQQTTYVRLLQAVTLAASLAASVDEAMCLALGHVCDHIGWPVGHVLYPEDDDGGALVSSGIWRLADAARFEPFREVSELMRFTPGVGLPGQVLVSGRPQWMADVHERSGGRTAELGRRLGISSGFACPVLVGAEVVAALEFFTDVATELDQPLLDVLGQIGTQLGRVVERQRAVEALQASEERFRSLVQNGRDLIVILDAEGRVTYATPSVERVLGHRATDLLGQTIARLTHPDDVAEVTERLAALFNGAPLDAPLQARTRHADGSWRYLEALGTNFLDHPSVRGVVITARDVTERKQLEARLERQAFYDPLTGLPNRALFQNRLDRALRIAARGDAAVGVMFLDLDRFKIINDSLGHAVGDQLLQSLGARLAGCLRGGDTVARLGGDEFVILLEGVREEAEATQIAERVIDTFRAPFMLDGHEVTLSTSIGIAVSEPARLRDGAGELLRMADIALYRAKATGRAGYAVFDASMNVFSVERLMLESDLRHAVERDELRLHYQPELDLATGAIVGVEALVRWEHPQRGLLPPGEFIPLAEETDLIVEIGQWALEIACRQARAWAEARPHASLVVSVNLSARQFNEPDIVARVAGALNATGVDPALVRLEITESILVQESAAAAATLRALKALGVSLAIDDFGAGYSSLSYLTRLAVDMLKVDRSFVSGANSDERSAAIVGAVVTLAHTLGMRVTAEGIETPKQLARMRAVGCDHGQGYLFARPLPLADVAALLSCDAHVWNGAGRGALQGSGQLAAGGLLDYVPLTHGN